jgi:6-phosphogluconolactonase
VSGDLPRGAVLRLSATPDALAEAVASEVLALLEAALAWRGEAHLVLSGGRTPAALHRVLASRQFEGWPHVHVWFGDERTVPPDHADSNYRMARETLLAHVPIPEHHVHRFVAELSPQEAAARYDAELVALAARQERAVPTFDVLLLGMGSDAHTASLFPGSPLLDALSASEPPRFARAVHVPSLDTWRLTLTPDTLRAARAVCLLVAGADKHAALRRVLATAPALTEAPVTLVHGIPGDVAWFVDRAALFGA